MVDPLRFPAPPAGGPMRRDPIGPMGEALAGLPAGLRVAQVPFPGLVLLRGEADDAAFAAAVERAVGHAPVAVPGAVRGGEGVHLLCLAADEWMAVLPSGREEVVLRALDQGLDGLAACAVDISDAHAVLDLGGPLIRPLLSKGCPLDLHPRALPEGACARTTLAGLDVIAQVLDGGGVRLFIGAEAARWVAKWVVDQASEY